MKDDLSIVGNYFNPVFCGQVLASVTIQCVPFRLGAGIRDRDLTGRPAFILPALIYCQSVEGVEVNFLTVLRMEDYFSPTLEALSITTAPFPGTGK